MASRSAKTGSFSPRRALRDKPPLAVAEEAVKASLILRYAHDTCNSLLSTFLQTLKDRAKTRATAKGAPTDEQMDLLRGMLVFAGAGLDSMLKQLIRDAVPALAGSDPAIQKGLETFAARRLRRKGAEESAEIDTKFLASVIASASPKDRILEAYVDDLTGGSLQSAGALYTASAALGLDSSVFAGFGTLAQAFEVRNQIVHELDINFEHPKRNRQTRALDPMVDMTNDVLGAAQIVLQLTVERLNANSGA